LNLEWNSQPSGATPVAVWLSEEELVALRMLVTFAWDCPGFPFGAVTVISRWESARGNRPVWATEDELDRLGALLRLPTPVKAGPQLRGKLDEIREELPELRRKLEDELTEPGDDFGPVAGLSDPVFEGGLGI
jgi:hypothetical protein